MPHIAYLTVPTSNLQKFTLFLALLLIPLFVRAYFDPSQTALELPYAQYRVMLSAPEGQKRIERINLQQGLTDLWGRDITTLKLRGESYMRFMVVPPGFYHESWQELRRTHIEAQNLCLDCTPVLQVLITEVLYACVLFSYTQKRT